MIIDLYSLKDASSEFDLKLPASEIDLESEGAEIVEDLKIRGKVSKKIAQTDVAGQISAVVKIECTRCLRAVEKKLEIPFAVTFVTAENYTEARESELSGEDLDVSIFEGAKIDLTELTREQILLNLPEQIFCAEDCKGFCQKCGANRNLVDCNCEEKEIDPRWQSLRELKIKE